MNRPILLLSTLLVLALAAPSYAELIAYEGFDYADVGTFLEGNAGGMGFAGVWEPIPNYLFPSDPFLYEIAEGSLSFGGITTTGNRIRNPARKFWPVMARTLADPVLPEDTRTMYFSFLVRPEANAENRIFGSGLLEGDGNSQELYLANSGSAFIGSNGAGEYMATDFSGEVSLLTGVFREEGETALMVVKAELSPGTDKLSVYINPTPGLPEPTADVVQGDMDINGSTAIFLASTGPHSIDELRWGTTFADVVPKVSMLHAGDADQDLDFDQFDLVQVQQAGKYMTGQPATWGEGDWNGAPGGSPDNPPDGDEVFDNFDIVAALQSGDYMQGSYAASAPGYGSDGYDLPAIGTPLGGGENAVVQLVYVPEPSTFLLSAVAMIGLIASARRKRG